MRFIVWLLVIFLWIDGIDNVRRWHGFNLMRPDLLFFRYDYPVYT